MLGKPWVIRPMTTEEVEQDPKAFCITDREAKEITYVPNFATTEGLAMGLRHEFGHVRYDRPKYWFYPETEGMPEDSSEWLDFKDAHPLWDVREDLFCELLASYYSLSIDPRDISAKRTIRSESKKARELGLSRNEVESIKMRAKETVMEGKE